MPPPQSKLSLWEISTILKPLFSCIARPLFRGMPGADSVAIASAHPNCFSSEHHAPACFSCTTRSDCRFVANSSRLRTALALPNPTVPRCRPSLRHAMRACLGSSTLKPSAGNITQGSRGEVQARAQRKEKKKKKNTAQG